MGRKRSKQLEMRLGTTAMQRLPMVNEQELVDALAELLLACAMETDGDERSEDDEHEDHR